MNEVLRRMDLELEAAVDEAHQSKDLELEAAVKEARYLKDKSHEIIILFPHGYTVHLPR